MLCGHRSVTFELEGAKEVRSTTLMKQSFLDRHLDITLVLDKNSVGVEIVYFRQNLVGVLVEIV